MRVTRAVMFVLLACWFAEAQNSNPEQLFQEAVGAQQRGDDVLALRKYQELLRTHPQAVVVRANLGATLFHLKRYDEAIEQYRLVLASDAGNRPIRLNLAQAYQEKGDHARAVQELEPLHQSDPSDLPAAMMLADSYVQLQRYGKAVSVLSPLETAQPEDLNLAWLLGIALIHTDRASEGVVLVERAAEKADNADAYLLAGRTRLDLAQYDLARHDADAALKLDPALAGLETLNGMILEHTGDYAGAETALRSALRTEEGDFDAYFYLGAILYFRRDLPEARSQLEHALQLQPQSPQAHYELALVARGEGRWDEALRNLEIAARRNPGWLQPHVELSALYYRLQRPGDGAREKQIVDRLMTEQQRAPAAMP